MLIGLRSVAVALVVSTLLARETHAQTTPPLPTGALLISGGVQIADQIDGHLGATVALERTFGEITKRFVLGVGASTGLRRSNFEGILDADYSVLVVPALGFLNVHYRVTSVPRLDVYIGTAAGVSVRWFKFTDCNATDDCDTETDTVISGGLQGGARWALGRSVMAWTELAVGKEMPRMNIGLSRRF